MNKTQSPSLEGVLLRRGRGWSSLWTKPRGFAKCSNPGYSSELFTHAIQVERSAGMAQSGGDAAAKATAD